MVDEVVRLVDARRGHAPVLRLGVDGCVEADAADLADRVADALRDGGREVLRVRQRDFLLPRGQRLEHGPRDPDVVWERWADDDALCREVLAPLGPGGSMHWLPNLRDPLTDRSTRAGRRPAHPGAVLVLDGRFLLRAELAGRLDVVVHLQTSPDAERRRLADDDACGDGGDELARVAPAWRRYLREADPAARADVVVRYDHPSRPALAGGSG